MRRAARAALERKKQNITFLLLALIFIPAAALAYPAVEEVTGKSGAHAWLLPVHNLPIINVSIVFRDSGYGHDPAGKEGTASLVSDMLMEGAGKRSAEQFSADLDRNAISISSDADTHDFSFHIKTLSRNKKLAFAMLKDMLQHPALPAPSLDRLKTQYAVMRKRLLESPEFMAEWQWNKLAYPNHPYSRIGIGSDESVAAIGVDDIKNFIRGNFTISNAVISVAGDLTAAELADILDDVFSGMPQKHDNVTQIAETTPAASGFHKFSMPASQSEVFFGLPGVKRNDPDFYPMYVLNEILGGSGFLSILTEKIRQEKGLVYTISTDLDTSRASPILKGSFGSRSEKAAEALKLLQSTISDISKGDISEQQVKDAKTSLIGALPVNTDTTAKLCSYLRIMQMENLGTDYLEKRSSLFEAVTHDDVVRVAKKYLLPEKMLIVEAGK